MRTDEESTTLTEFLERNSRLLAALAGLWGLVAYLVAQEEAFCSDDFLAIPLIFAVLLWRELLSQEPPAHADFRLRLFYYVIAGSFVACVWHWVTLRPALVSGHAYVLVFVVTFGILLWVESQIGIRQSLEEAWKGWRVSTRIVWCLVLAFTMVVSFVVASLVTPLIPIALEHFKQSIPGS